MKIQTIEDHKRLEERWKTLAGLALILMLLCFPVGFVVGCVLHSNVLTVGSCIGFIIMFLLAYGIAIGPMPYHRAAQLKSPAN